MEKIIYLIDTLVKISAYQFGFLNIYGISPSLGDGDIGQELNPTASRAGVSNP